MKVSKKGIAILGLIFITFLAAIQYVFYQNIPDSVSTFAFVCITNVIGVLILGVLKIKTILKTEKGTIKKGIILALELTGYSFFMVLGSKSMDSVIVASIVSLYFVFVTPILLMLKKKVNFFSSIATVIAVIALFLMLGTDISAMFSQISVVYLIIADVFFAAYVVSVSILGENEDTFKLSFVQMAFAAAFAFIGWVLECLIGHKSMSFPMTRKFWISVIFIGIFIRVVYGLIQIASQKHVSALCASLIFASEIIITMITNPIMCAIFGTEYTPSNLFQIIGAVFFIIATLMIDEVVMSKLGYKDMLEEGEVDENGKEIKKSSVSKKMTLTTITFSMVTLIISLIICLMAISYIRVTAVKGSKNLGNNASDTSTAAMTEQLESSISTQANDKTILAEQKLSAYSDSVLYAAEYAKALLTNKEAYPKREVLPSDKANAGVWTMQRNLVSKDVTYEDVKEQSEVLGNMIDVFAPIVENNNNITTIYIGTEEGIIVSYDPNSNSGETIGEGYFNYKERPWYLLGKEKESYSFTSTYKDDYGRGLTITCVSPVIDDDGNFLGCVAMDVLMSEINKSMVNDNIIKPSEAVLIDSEGGIIAGKGADISSDVLGNIFDEGEDENLKEAGKEILSNEEGVTKAGSGDKEEYIAYSTIDSTGWKICILSPVSSVMEPVTKIQNDINKNTKNISDDVLKRISIVIQSCLILSALILLLVTAITGRFSSRITEPLKKLEEDVSYISKGNLDRKIEVDTDDEIGSLARSFDSMKDSLKKHIEELKEVTAKEERIAMELSMATNIQASMLPNHFPAFPDRKDFDIYASMTPAKEVGGDFYDFFLIDDDHLGMVMADVSGKGVPAALFMMMSKIIVNNFLTMAGANASPAAVLKNVNDYICNNNEEEMFVTVWLGILTISTGRVVAANAGHECPVIKNENGEYILYKDKHGFVIGGMEGMKYKDYEFTLGKDGVLFLYTDGVAEAMDKDDEMYGTKRLIDTLNSLDNDEPKNILEKVKESVDEFVGEAPQFDDLTMMAIKIK